MQEKINSLNNYVVLDIAHQYGKTSKFGTSLCHCYLENVNLGKELKGTGGNINLESQETL